MLKEALYHQSYGNYAYPIGEDELLLQLRSKKRDLDNVDE
ncbi:alpha amylase N-terminal ig-like domain-containing protein [Halanaerobaculum tunisiense]